MASHVRTMEYLRDKVLTAIAVVYVFKTTKVQTVKPQSHAQMVVKIILPVLTAY